jgi:hypothetical protein
MSSYYYRGKQYKKKPSPLTRTLKKIANRVLEATSGSHPGGAQALVDKMIEQYPEKPKQPAEAPVSADATKDGVK